MIDVGYEVDSDYNLLLQRKKANKFFWETQEGLDKLVLNDRILILHYWVVSPEKSLYTWKENRTYNHQSA